MEDEIASTLEDYHVVVLEPDPHMCEGLVPRLTMWLNYH